MAEVTAANTVRWRDSLTFRVIVLCAFLVVCLLGSVYIITGHYFREVVQELDASTREMATRVQVLSVTYPLEDFDPEDPPPELEEVFEGEGRLIDLQFIETAAAPGPSVPTISQQGLVFVTTQTRKCNNKRQSCWRK